MIRTPIRVTDIETGRYMQITIFERDIFFGEGFSKPTFDELYAAYQDELEAVSE